MASPKKLYIMLGKSADLALAEVESIAKTLNLPAPVKEKFSFCSLETDIHPQDLIDRSGGIVKVYQSLSDEIRDEVALISKDLINSNQAHFALSSVQPDADLSHSAVKIKKELVQAGIKPHFRIIDNPLASAGILTKSSEYLITEHLSLPKVLKAIAAQNLDHWTDKDYGRPMVDPHSGMLPPKIARMMINLSLTTLPKNDLIVYDPFSGSGTVLVEALDLGCSAYGSDINNKAVLSSNANTEWFLTKYGRPGTSLVIQKDVHHVKVSDFPKMVDAIVFEGYLGPPNPDLFNVTNIIKGLEKMYRGVFKNLYPFLKPEGKLVCALPEFVLRDGLQNLDKVIDWCSSLGYTLTGRFTYGRPQAVVRRAIYVLQKSA